MGPGFRALLHTSKQCGYFFRQLLGPSLLGAEPLGTLVPADRAMVVTPGPVTSACAREWRRLSDIAQHISPGLFGTIANYVVIPRGEAVFCNGVRYMRAVCQDPGSCHPEKERQILLKVKESDWVAICWTDRPLKILQARLEREEQWQWPVLDCTGGDTVIVSQVTTCPHEALCVAELFTGGYMGWSQGAYLLHRLGAPVSIKWGLEKARDTFPMQQTMVPGIQVIASRDALLELAMPPPNMIMLHADVNENWWMDMFSRVPVNAWTVSAPCQPWSLAGRETGLGNDIGCILLRLADIAAVFQPSIVMFEQVAGFAVHRDRHEVLSAWQSAGYVIMWRATLELSDLLPCTRNRHLLVMALRKHYHCQPALEHVTTWGTKIPTSLSGASALFDMPWEMLKVHIPPAHVLDKYLHPAYVPVSHRNAQISPKEYRLKSPNQKAGCFLAQYGYAHLLPDDLLASKGLFGSLVVHGPTARFFAACEIASMHGTILPTICMANRRLSMRLLGNCISVPHATITLLKGLHMMGLSTELTVSEVIEACLELRIRNDNAIFLPKGSEWVMCHVDQAPQVLCMIDAACLCPRPPALSALLQPLTLQTDASAYEVWLTPAIPWQVSLAALGYPEEVLARSNVQFVNDQSVVYVPFQPLLPGTEDERQHVKNLGLVIISTCAHVAVVPASSPTHLVRPTEHVHPDDGPLFLARTSGSRVQHVHALPPVTLLLPEPSLQDILPASAFAFFGQQDQLQICRDHVVVDVLAQRAFEVWAGWPIAHLRALGWSSTFSPSLPDGSEDLRVTMVPVEGKVRITVEGLCKILAQVCIAARLEALHEQTRACPMVAVEVSLVAHHVWSRTIPAGFHLDILEQWWQEVARVTHLEPGSRVYSGPHRVPMPATPQSLLTGDSGPCLRRRHGTLSLSVHPHYHAGGNKEENKQLAMTKLATLCLTQGADLTSTTVFVNALLDAAGAQKLSQIMSDVAESNRWEAVCDLAKLREVSVPELANQHAKAEARARKASQRAKAQHQKLMAADIVPDDGFFINEDGTAAVFLEQMTPGATGVYVVDPPQAPELISTLSGVQPDELAILVVGHFEHPQQPCLPVSFPALAGDPPSRVLIAGHLCNLGGKHVSLRHAAQAEVKLQETFCCQFMVHQNDLEPDQWLQLTQHPVRYVTETFKSSGCAKTFASPWARSFTCQGRPSAPAAAEQLSFHARVDKDDMEPLLKASGHNCMYVIPKTWDKQPHPSYAVIWLGSNRAEAVRAAMQCSDQLGVVRNKSRFGIRVHEKHYNRVYAALMPGKQVPTKMVVTLLFRAGPFPLQAGPEDIVSWAEKCKWTIKVMKSLGAAHWLLGANQAPPAHCVAFNGHAVLLSPIKGREQQRPTLQSGHVQKVPTSTVAQLSPKDEDPWLHNDPWKAYRKPQTASTLGSRSMPAASAAAVRSLEGPTEARFKEHDMRMGAIEAGLQELKQQSQERFEQLQAERQEDRSRSQASIADLNLQVQSMSTEFSKQLQQSVESLQGAQAQQMQQVMMNFDELKSLLSCRDRDPSKKPRVSGAE